LGGKSDNVPRKNHGGGSHNKQKQKSILEGQEHPMCSFCGIKVRVVSRCHTKKKEQQETKANIKTDRVARAIISYISGRPFLGWSMIHKPAG
jgi:hypothetical protein